MMDEDQIRMVPKVNSTDSSMPVYGFDCKQNSNIKDVEVLKQSQ